MVFLGRILDGITAGNLSTAQAYISDHTKPENRAKAFGVIGVAFGIGFMFGPALGGGSASYGCTCRSSLAACLSALSIICTYTLLPERSRRASRAPTGRSPVPGGKRPERVRRRGRTPSTSAAPASARSTSSSSCSRSRSPASRAASRCSPSGGSTPSATSRAWARAARSSPRWISTCAATPRGYVLIDGNAIEHGQWRVVNREAVELTGPPCAVARADREGPGVRAVGRARGRPAVRVRRLPRHHPAGRADRPAREAVRRVSSSRVAGFVARACRLRPARLRVHARDAARRRP